MASNIVETLKDKGLTLSSSESFTGGGFANYITNIPGASNIYKGGMVTYCNEMKHQLLNVKQETLDKFGAISKECVYEMVSNTQKIFNTDIAVSFSGNAGPGTSEGKECGLVYIGIAFKDKIEVNELMIKKERVEVKKEAIEFAINKILKYCEDF